MSADDIETYYENAIFTYSDYPYLQENEMEFDTIYKINTEFYIKGKNSKDSGQLEWFVVKIDNKYYLLHIQYNQFINMFMG